MPDWARSVPQYAPVSTQKAGISAENELKAGFLLANNARRTVRSPQSDRGRLGAANGTEVRSNIRGV
jgi:hypothetical protein